MYDTLSMEKEYEILVAVTTYPDIESARKTAHSLVCNKYVACAQLSNNPVTSFYMWDDKYVEASEFVLTIKFAKSRLAKVKSEVMRLHPYECPQWYTISPNTTSPKYAQWVIAQSARVKEHKVKSRALHPKA